MKRKYKYDIYSAEEWGKCPICGGNKNLFYMSEKREYFNPITKKMGLTQAGCCVYEASCYDCQIKSQRQ